MSATNENARATLDAIMEQAQVFASSWSLVESRFAADDQMERAAAEKAELRNLIERALAAQPAVQSRLGIFEPSLDGERLNRPEWKLPIEAQTGIPDSGPLRVALQSAYDHGLAAAPFAMEDCVRKTLLALAPSPVATKQNDDGIDTADRLPEDGQAVIFVVRSSGTFAYLNGKRLGGTYVAGRFGGFCVPGLQLDASRWLPMPTLGAAPTQSNEDDSR